MKKKVSTIDYSKAMLPRTRKAQLGDCFKMSYSVILKCGLMLLVFFAPMIAFSFFMDFYYVSLLSHATEEVEQTILIFHYLYNAGLILFSYVALLGLSGVIRVLRNLIWGEGVFFHQDFTSGIKENAGKNTIFAVIFSIFYAGAYVVYSLFPTAIISLFGLFLFALVFLPIYFWIMFLNNTYDSKFGQLLRNSLLFYIRTIGWTLVGILMPLSLVGLYFIPFNLIWLKYIILVLFVVFIFPIIVLIMNLYTTSKFDVYINKENYPDYFMRGLNHD